MKYKGLMTDKNMQGYKGGKPDQAHSPTRKCWKCQLCEWKGGTVLLLEKVDSLELNLVYGVCIQSFKKYMHPVLFFTSVKTSWFEVITIFDLQRLAREEKYSTVIYIFDCCTCCRK